MLGKSSNLLSTYYVPGILLVFDDSEMNQVRFFPQIASKLKEEIGT